MSSSDSKKIVNLHYKKQNQQTQKKLLNFLVNKDISFYQATPKNFEAIVQIYNIQSNKKTKATSKSPAKIIDTSESKSPKRQINKESLKKKKNSSSPNLNVNRSVILVPKEKKILKKTLPDIPKKDLNKPNSQKELDKPNFQQKNDMTNKNEKTGETIKKKAISIHQSPSKQYKKNKAQSIMFVNELHKNFGGESNERRKSKKSLKEVFHQDLGVESNDRIKSNRSLMKELNKNLQNESSDKIKNKKFLKEDITLKTNISKTEITQEIKNKEINLDLKNNNKKKSTKNESSVKILQKNKQILDNLINANSVLEFEALKNNEKKKSTHFETQRNLTKNTITSEPQETLSNSNSQENILKITSKTKKKSKTPPPSNKQKKPLISTKENLPENKSVSDKIENNFKQIVSLEFSRVPSGEKINKNSINLQFQKAVQILYERLDLLSSEELIFYYKFIVNKAKKLYLDFLQKRGLVVN